MRKKIKNLLICLLVIILVVSMVGCRNKEPEIAGPIIVSATSSVSGTIGKIVESIEETVESTVDSATEIEGVKPSEKEEIKESEVSETKPNKEEEGSKENIDVKYEAVDEIVYATSAVNVRSGPSTDYDVVGLLNYTNEVKRIGIGNNGWSKVIFENKEAYVNSSYLSLEKLETPIWTDNYPLTYSDDTCTITIYREWYEDAWVYAAHLEFTNYTRLGTSCANGKYSGGYETTSNAAKRLGAVFAINGCYSASSLDYIVVRDGKICNGASRNMWVPAIYSDNNGKLLSAWETGGTKGIAGVNVQSLVDDGLVTDTFCFGPPILADGVVTSGSDTSRAQRTFIGTNGNAGDLWCVVSNGRYNDSESAGLTYKQMANYLVSKDCTFGVPLDGGGSSTMVFQGQVLNIHAGSQRAVVDFVYFK